MDCLFCKIVKKEIPNYTVYEDGNVLAFLDIHPCAKGHTVVIPKNHADDLSAMSDTEYACLLDGVRHAAKRVREVLKPDALNIGVNDGHAAGQAVAHAHWHIIPRWNGDGGGSMHSIIKKESEIKVEEVIKLFI